MLIGLFVYLWGQKHLAEDHSSLNAVQLDKGKPLSQQEWQAIGGLVILATLNILFWAVYEQQGNTLQLFADTKVDWNIGGSGYAINLVSIIYSFLYHFIGSFAGPVFADVG